jgi:hypothetical protein
MERLRQQIAQVLHSANYPAVNIRGGKRRVGRPRKVGAGMVGGRYALQVSDLAGMGKRRTATSRNPRTARAKVGRPRASMGVRAVAGGRRRKPMASRMHPRRPVKASVSLSGVGRKKKPSAKKSVVRSNYKTERGYQIAKLMSGGLSLGQASKKYSGKGTVRG